MDFKLWVAGRRCDGPDDEGVQLSGDVALEAADGLTVGLAFSAASPDVAAAGGVPAQLGEGDAVES